MSHIGDQPEQNSALILCNQAHSFSLMQVISNLVFSQTGPTLESDDNENLDQTQAWENRSPAQISRSLSPRTPDLDGPLRDV